MKITKTQVEVFEFLNDLRESGVTNMLGAAPYIMVTFDMEADQARRYLSSWMENFRKDGNYKNIDLKN